MKVLALTGLLAAVATSAAWCDDALPPSTTVPMSVMPSTTAAQVPFVPSSSTIYSVANASGPATILTLPQCLQIAFLHATDVLKSRNDVEFTGIQLVQAYLQFLPSVDSNAAYSWQTGRDYLTLGAPSLIDTTNRGINYEVIGDLNIFNGFSDYGALRSAKGKSAAAQLTLYRAKQAIALDITQAYLQVVLDRRLLAYAQGNYQSSQQREALLNAQTQVGMTSLTDLYRQQAQTSADELYLIDTRNRARDDLIFLLRRLRVDLTQNYEIADLPPPTIPAVNPYTDENALLRTALTNRPDLAAARDLSEATHWDVVTARGGYFPRLDATANLEGTSRLLDKQIVNGVNDVPASQNSLAHQLGSQVLYNAGAVLTWGLFDRYLTLTTVARSNEIAQNAAIDYEDRLLQVEGEVKQSVGDYAAAGLQIASATKGIQAAQEAFHAVQARYAVGASSIVDLLLAQSALLQAEASMAQAQVNFILQDKTIELAIGATTVP